MKKLKESTEKKTRKKRESKKEKKQRSVTIVFDPNNIILNLGLKNLLISIVSDIWYYINFVMI